MGKRGEYRREENRIGLAKREEQKVEKKEEKK
jgi:hypothetical protein